MLEIVTFLHEYFKGNDDKIIAWLTHYNPHIGATPIKLIEAGRGYKIISYINSVKEGF